MSNGRILRVRLDLSYAVSDSATLRDASVYGTPGGFRGRGRPGDAFTADGAFEYSLTRSWVLALDVVYSHAERTHLAAVAGDTSWHSEPRASYSLALAPVIEYSWNASLGLLVGVRVIAAGRNTAASLTPAVALNMVY